jgi:mannose-1-phosphate guanylyltransferase
MKVILLAAGYGSRLRPITNKIPKCMVEIKKQPLLDFWLEKLTKINCGPFLINTHYLSDKVESYIKHSSYIKDVVLAYEPALEGTAGTLLKNLNFFNGEDGMLIHADNYCLDDLKKLIDAHEKRPKKCLLTMLVFRTKTPNSCGIVETDQDGIVIDFHEKKENPPGNLANGAIYILSSELLRTIQDKFYNAKEFTLDIISNLKGQIFVYETKEYFIDIGSLDNYKEANER